MAAVVNTGPRTIRATVQRQTLPTAAPLGSDWRPVEEALMTRLPLAIVVLTYNEELNLPGCLSSLRGLGATLVVVDSGSTDRTLAIAADSDARILVHEFVGHAA